MALTVALILNGTHHASTSGTGGGGGSTALTIGAGVGQVPATGAGQLLQVELPFPASQWSGSDAQASFARQLYVQCQSLDGNVTAIVAHGTPVVFPAGALPRAQFLVDLTAAGAVQMWVKSEATVSR